MRRVILILIILATLSRVKAQEGESIDRLDRLDYKLELQSSFSNEKTPLWLNANKYGLSSLEKSNGYLRAKAGRALETDSAHQWGLAYALDAVIPSHYTSDFILQQAFVEVRWKKGVLTVGSKEWPMRLKNDQLSSGPQTLGINARPVPQMRIALPDYWTLPVLNGWLHLKGHVAYGWTTDDRWQRGFTQKNSKYTKNAKYHSKAGYLKVGKRSTPLSVELGLEMASQFGGTSYLEAVGGIQKVKNEDGLSAMWHAFVPGGVEAVDGSYYQNTSGNNLGSWVAQVNLHQPSWSLSVYADHFFEDHSAMLFLDYDGYGSGADWNKKKEKRFVLYDMKDVMLGAEMRLKDCHWLNNLVCEYLYSKYQSGPIYHDHTITMSDHIGGKDNYYNHYVFTGWQHWGQVMGNPLYLSPIYNTDKRIEVRNNRFVAWHLGFSGQPHRQWAYRVLCSWQRGYGTYDSPFPHPEESICALAEADYQFPARSVMNGWSVKAAVGKDWGKIFGNNSGIQLTIVKSGFLHINAKK